MTFLELARKRFSVRKFTDQPVEKEKLDKVLEAGNIAPTAKNLQPQRIYVLQSEEALKKAYEKVGKEPNERRIKNALKQWQHRGYVVTVTNDS